MNESICTIISNTSKEILNVWFIDIKYHCACIANHSRCTALWQHHFLHVHWDIICNVLCFVSDPTFDFYANAQDEANLAGYAFFVEHSAQWCVLSLC